MSFRSRFVPTWSSHGPSTPGVARLDRSVATVIAGLALLVATDAARAELYRCVGADGRTVYTDSQATCPGAGEHQPKGEVQSFRGAVRKTRSASRAMTPAAMVNAPVAGGEAKWRTKKRQTNEELIAVNMRIDKMRPLVKICNRGGELYRTQTNGLRKSVSCGSLRSLIENLEGRRGELQEYLDHGLSEECRKSGCLPGWLR